MRGRRALREVQHRAGQPAGAGALRRLEMAAARRRRPASPPRRREAARAALRAPSIARAQPRATTCDDAPTITDAEYDALFRELAGARGRASGAASRRTRRRSASAARRRQRSTPVTHRVPMLSIRNETDSPTRTPTQFDARARASSLGADAPSARVLASQVRRPRDQPALRERARSPSARRAATARPART